MRSRAQTISLLLVICAAVAYPTVILNIIPPVDQMSGSDAEFWLVALLAGVALGLLGLCAIGWLAYLMFRDRRYGGGLGRGGNDAHGDDGDEHRGRRLPREAYGR